MDEELGMVSSAFGGSSFQVAVDEAMSEVAALYKSDSIPWVIGYSGGKDSTAALQLVWLALAGLSKEDLAKPVYVISTDTLVENPIVALWVSKSLEKINLAARKQKLPITAHRLTPEIASTFWVNLIGRGYPAPRPKFRWCTERLKIQPSNRFISSIVQRYGEAIVVLGTRKAESAKRAENMEKYESQRVRQKLSPNSQLPNAFIYSPLENWTNDDVWLYLMQIANPWGYRNKDLLSMYQGASDGGECPLVVDTTTPSCGDSRFGCWVCTLVSEDKSMKSMIQNDEEKEWMLPLLQLRNELDPPKTIDSDRHLRDFRRMNGSVQLFLGRPIPGPYRQEVRANWLRKVLSAQVHIKKHAPPEIQDIELITLEELEEIRRIWVVEKHEMEDQLPRIYEDITGTRYSGRHVDDNQVFGSEELAILAKICAGNELHYQLTRELISVEKKYKSLLRRSGLFQAVDRAFLKHFYEDQDDAVARIATYSDSVQSIRRSLTGNSNTSVHPMETQLESSQEAK